MKLLDLFCGAGGAAMGYHRAGFTEIVGVDTKPQPRYPFEFVLADALTFSLDGFDAYHASPPCQDYSSAMRHRQSERKARLIDVIQERFEATGKPWIIENVVGAPIPRRSNLFGEHGTMVCGTSVGLNRVWRHRLFKSSFSLKVSDCQHVGRPLNPYNTQSRKRDGLEKGSMRAYAKAMDVEWMRDKEATLAIPPAYTEFIGRQLMEEINNNANSFQS